MNELDWLTDQRPQTPEDDELARARARRVLLEHVTPAPPPRRRVPRRAATLSVAALAAVAVIVAWPAGSTRTPPLPIKAPEAAQAAPLVRLSQRIAQEPAPKGNATLILRSHHFPQGKDFTGADLYLDDGRYFYAMTARELKTAAENSDYNDRVVKAAIAAPSLSTAEARQRMIDATWGGKEPTKADLVPPAAAAEAAKRKGTGTWTKPASEKTIDENRIWLGSTDALLAGAGRADVRAGVMALLATIDTVKVSETADTLTLTATDYPEGYTETYTVDAKTGVPQRFVGGVAGKAPDVTVTYEIKRVTAANWADGAA